MKEHRKKIARVDMNRVFHALVRRLWVVVIAAILCGAVILGVTCLFVTPEYEADALFYVANSSLSISSTTLSLSSSDLTAAQSLVQTYIVILNSRSTLEAVISAGELDYSPEELSEMIHAGAVNETEIFQVTVTSTDPQEARYIANAIAVVLPEKISSIVEGSSVFVVDYAVDPTEHSSPNYWSSAFLGMLAGFVLSVLIIVLAEINNRTIRSENYLSQTYPDVPLLAVIPDAHSTEGGYYRAYRHRKDGEKGGARR